MTPKARGETGSVRGLEPDVATKVLVRLVSRLLEKKGRVVTRRDVRAELEYMGHDSVTEHQLEGMLLAFERMPGLVKARAGGVYVMPERPEVWARHRTWRYTMGRLDLADAQVFYAMMYEFAAVDGDRLPPRLWRQMQRLGLALQGVLGDIPKWPEKQQEDNHGGGDGEG